MIWFQIHRDAFTTHIFDLQIQEPNAGVRYGRSLKIRQVRDIVFYLKNYGGRLSAVVGLALPFIPALARSFLG